MIDINSFDKRVLNIIIIVALSFITFSWSFFIFHWSFNLSVVLWVIFLRVVASVSIFKDFSLSWSKATQKTFIIKSVVNIVAFVVYMPFFYRVVPVSLLLSELFFYLFIINFFMYLYYLFKNRSTVKKEKTLVIYGAGKAGLKLEEEYRDSIYKTIYFIDDDRALQKRSIDGIKIISDKELIKKFDKKPDKRFDLLIIAIPSAKPLRIRKIYSDMKRYFKDVRILPPMDKILSGKSFATQLKNISLEDLLARHPQDLDKKVIGNFLKNRRVLVTGAGGSIGSEICRQCLKYGVEKLYMVDHSEYNLYTIKEELDSPKVKSYMFTILNKNSLQKAIEESKPDIIIHAAAYKHVPLVEENIEAGVENNIIGTKNCIDLAIKYGVRKFILISTDKAVRPTSVMGASKRVCELYAGNIESNETEIVTVRFGNVLGSSGSVIPKFRRQIENGGPITITHPDITRYFMLIPEACELVLQTGAIAEGGEIFILNMGEPIKIVDLAKNMIELSGKEEINIEFIGLRPGEKLYEELVMDEGDMETKYSSITIAKNRKYDIEKLNYDIKELMICRDKIKKLQEIVPEFTHKL